MQYAAAPLHSAQLTYANRRWTMQVFARVDGNPGSALRDEWPVRSSGTLGTLIAAYTGFVLVRRQRARRIANELAMRFEQLLEAHPFAVYAFDRAGRVIYANRKMQQELGLTTEQLIGRPATSFVAPNARALADLNFQNAVSGQALPARPASCMHVA